MKAQKEKVYAKGFKGFNPGMTCRGKQYKEDTVFTEKEAKMCEKGMHFCESPLAVLGYYPLLNDNGELSEFAKVEALAPVETEENKSVTTKLKVGKKLSLGEFIREAVKFLLGKGTTERTKASSGSYSKLAASGDDSKLAASGAGSSLAASGSYSKLAASGDASIVVSAGRFCSVQVGKAHCIAASMGEGGRVKGALGASLVCAEWDSRTLLCVKHAKVDGKRIKADTWYTVKNGKWVKEE